jgi:proteasome lid subunit RPN8/RPN11
MFKIKKTVLEDLFLAAKNNFPNEFFAYLGGEKEVIDEFILINSTYGKGFVLIKDYLTPWDKRILGTMHSHPGKNNFPSNADKKQFSRKGKIHLIISYPYNLNTVKAFNEKAELIEFELID